MIGLGYPDTGNQYPDNGQVLDARDPLAEKEGELQACQRTVEDEMLKHTKAVEVTRAMALNNHTDRFAGSISGIDEFLLDVHGDLRSSMYPFLCHKIEPEKSLYHAFAFIFEVQ